MEMVGMRGYVMTPVQSAKRAAVTSPVTSVMPIGEMSMVQAANTAWRN